MIKINKNSFHSCSQDITPTAFSNQNKRSNKLSLQTVNTTRIHDNKISVNRVHTQCHKVQTSVPFQDQWEETFNRRQNYLNSMFYRRKAALENISKKNRDIYIRISTQQSHYPISKMIKSQTNQQKTKNSMQNLTANSRLMLMLSRNALNESNQLNNKLKQMKDKQNPLKSIQPHKKGKQERRSCLKQLTPIIQNIETSATTAEIKIIESRFVRDDFGFPQSNSKCQQKFRNRSVGRTRVTDVYVNF